MRMQLCFVLDCSQHGVSAEAFKSVVIFHAKRRPQGHLQCWQNVSFVKGGGETTITPKHLSILHAITLQECHVFELYGVTITLMNLNQATAVRLTLALHLLISKVNSYCLLVTLRIHLKKNSSVIGKFKYYLAQRFSNSGISRTPKLPQIRPGRDPYLIRLFSRLPH